MTKLTRREALVGAAATAAGVMVASTTGASAQLLKRRNSGGKGKKLTNKDFYDAEGNFLPEKAKEAYYAMFKKMGYPMSDAAKELFWVADFGMGDFVNCGMGGIFWYNNQEECYFGHEIFLLPNQMIPEHKHLKTEKGKPKHEAWLIRHGHVYNFAAVGKKDEKMLAMIPESQKKSATVRSAKKAMPGEVQELPEIGCFHFMMAGPEGAIATEFGTFHDNDGLRFANPKAKM